MRWGRWSTTTEGRRNNKSAKLGPSFIPRRPLEHNTPLLNPCTRQPLGNMPNQNSARLRRAFFLVNFFLFKKHINRRRKNRLALRSTSPFFQKILPKGGRRHRQFGHALNHRRNLHGGRRFKHNLVASSPGPPWVCPIWVAACRRQSCRNANLQIGDSCALLDKQS